MDSFLDSDERLIAVYQRVGPISPIGLGRLRDAGIKTILVQGIPSWHNIEYSDGNYSWDLIDRCLNDILGADLKALLAVYHMPPSWVPGAFTFGNRAVQWRVARYWLDPMNQVGREYEKSFLLRFLERYDIPNVCCYCTIPGAGERLLPPNKDCTSAEAVDVVLSRQALFARYESDLWTSYHPATVSEGRGNQHFDAVHEALEREFPDHNHWRLLWTFFTCANTQWMLDDRYWVGAEYAKGVVKNAKRLDRWGARGMIMAPTDWKQGPVIIDDEVAEATRRAVQILGEKK